MSEQRLKTDIAVFPTTIQNHDSRVRINDEHFKNRIRFFSFKQFYEVYPTFERMHSFVIKIEKVR